jgi:hypothetical protein
VDFIEQVLLSEACDSLDFEALFYAQNAKVDPIIAFFSPLPLD